MKKLFLLLAAPLLFSCGPSNNEKSTETIPTHSYEEVKDKTIDFADSLNRQENVYFVYCFSHVCEYCEQIKNEVIHIALKKVKTIYFCSTNVVEEELDPEATIGCTEIEDLFVGGYPSLIEIKNATVTRNLLGKTKVMEALRK